MWVIWSRLSAFTLTDQSGLETKARSVLFLLRREREEFSINLFHLVLWSCYTKQSVRCVSWVVSQSPPSRNPLPVLTVSELLQRHVQYVYLTNRAYIYSGTHAYIHIQLSKETQTQLKSGDECLLHQKPVVTSCWYKTLTSTACNHCLKHLNIYFNTQHILGHNKMKALRVHSNSNGSLRLYLCTVVLSARMLMFSRRSSCSSS